MTGFDAKTEAQIKATNLPRWALYLIGIFGVGLGVLLLLLAAGLALVVVPLFILGVVIASWHARRQARKHGRSFNAGETHPDPDMGNQGKPKELAVIEAEYQVIEPRQKP